MQDCGGCTESHCVACFRNGSKGSFATGVCLSGGVALQAGMLWALQKALGCDVQPVENP